MDQDNRIWFPGNPWPEGHPIKLFKWTSDVREGMVWFNFHLETADYYSERDIDTGSEEFDSAWEIPDVWGNYHSCTISGEKWHRGGFPVCRIEEFSTADLDGYEAQVDCLPLKESFDWDDLAFHTYLLGHDSVAGHRIKFTRRTPSGRFNIEWTGKVALVYAGDHEYRYDFRALIGDVAVPEVAMPS